MALCNTPGLSDFAESAVPVDDIQVVRFADRTNYF